MVLYILISAQLNVTLFWIPLRDLSQNKSLDQILSTWKPIYPGQSQILLTIFIYSLNIFKSGVNNTFLPKLEDTETFILIVQVSWFAKIKLKLFCTKLWILQELLTSNPVLQTYLLIVLNLIGGQQNHNGESIDQPEESQSWTRILLSSWSRLGRTTL